MPAPATCDDFLDIVRKSGLIDPPRLDAFLRQLSGEQAPRHLASLLIGAGLLTHFQAEQLLLGKWRGFTIGKYRVLERLGSGGNGTVYLCEHQVVRRKVAVKVLPTSRAESPAALARFYREARAAGSLDHPNLVKAHDIDQDNGLHFLVMDYVDGATLQQIVSRTGPLSVPRAVDYIRQTALGLQHAHQSGLVHRDVKPANILLDRHGTVRLLDLGLARFFCDQNDPLTLKYDEKNVLGTADYVAPEQALNSHEVDIRADIYSLGATFYFLLTGQPPFPGGKVTQKLMWHQVRQPTPVRQLRPDVPEGVAAVVARMLAKDPRQRYQEPAEVAEALTPWAEPVPPPTDAEMPHLSPAARGPLTGEGERSSSQGTRMRSGGSSSSPSSDTKRSNTPEPATPSRLASAETATRASVRPTPPVASLLPTMAPVAPSALLSPPTGERTGQYARRQRQAMRLAIILILGACFGMAMRWAVGRPGQAGAGLSLAEEPAPLIVARDGKPGTFPTLQAALDQAAEGAHIVVQAETWDEVLDHNGKTRPLTGLRIEGRSPSGRPVLWHPPAGHPADRPLIHLGAAAGLTLAGFTLDGEGHLDDLVLVTEACPGLTLEGLTLRGFRRHGVVLRECRGDMGRPVLLQRVRISPGRASCLQPPGRPTTDRPARSALQIESAGQVGCGQIRVTGCRLEGPFEAVAILAGPMKDVMFHANRVFNTADGLLIQKKAPAPDLELTLSSNTFCGIQKAGLHFEALPSSGSRLSLTRNLLVHTGQLAQSDDLLPGQVLPPGRLTLEAFGNFRDRDSQDGLQLFDAVPRPLELAIDPADDDHFLRYPPGTFHDPAEAPGVPLMQP
jgi:serine/threonine protein kinase